MYKIKAVSVIGGHIDRTEEEEPKQELKVVILTSEGGILYWQESLTMLNRSLFQELPTDLCVKDLHFNTNELLLVSYEGKAYKAVITPLEDKIAELAHCKKRELEDVANSSFVKVKLEQIPMIYTAFSATSDPTGQNYAILQDNPLSFMTDFVEVSPSCFTEDILGLLDEQSEIHDLTLEASSRTFLTHRFILSRRSGKFKRLVGQCSEVLRIENVHPFVLQIILEYIYGKAIDLYNYCKQVKEVTSSIKNPQADGNSNKENDNLKKDPISYLRRIAEDFQVWGLMEETAHFVPRSTEKPRRTFDWTKSLKYCDVWVKTKDGDLLGAHKCILYARCEYFKSMFGFRWNKDTTDEISFDFTTPVVQLFLIYVYSDKLPSDKTEDVTTICKLLVLADHYNIPRLAEMCQRLLCDHLTLKNVVQVATFATIYNASKLKNFCFEFTCKNLPMILESRILESAEDVLLEDLTDFYLKWRDFHVDSLVKEEIPECYDEVISIFKKHPVDMDFYEEGETHKLQSQKKKRNRTRKSASKIFSPKSPENEEVKQQIQIGKSDNCNDDSNAVTKNNAGRCLRFEAIKIAQRTVESEEVQSDFTKLTLVSPTFTNNLESFPSLGSSGGKSPSGKFEMGKISRLSQKQRKRLSSQGTEEKVKESPEPCKNPWKIPDAVSPGSPVAVQLDFTKILNEEKKHKDCSIRIKAKPLSFTVLEDKALEELYKFYNGGDICEEIITVQRVCNGIRYDPVWVQKTK